MKAGDRVEFLTPRDGWIRATITKAYKHDPNYIFYDIAFDEPRSLLGEPWRGTRVWEAEQMVRKLSLLELIAEAAA